MVTNRAILFAEDAGATNLTIDTSVFCLLTPNDPELPRELVLESDGKDRFRNGLRRRW